MDALHKSSGLSATIPAARDSEQSTIEEFSRASRRRQTGVFTLSCSAQCLPWENHTWYPQRTVHCHFNWWLACLRPPFCRCRRSDGDSDNERQDLRHPLVASSSTYSMGVNIERSKYHWEQQKQHQCQCYHELWAVGRSVKLQLGNNLVQRWHVQSRDPHQNRHSHSGDGEP